MEKLIILCLCTLVSTVRLDQGYRYNNAITDGSGLKLPSSSSSSFSSSAINNGHGHMFLQEAFQNSQLMQTLLNSPPQPKQIQTPFSYHQNIRSGQQFASTQGNFYQPMRQHHLQHVAPTITKDIYVHVPPEQPQEYQDELAHVSRTPPRKHYRILFIKAPTPPSSAASLKLAQTPIEEKTIIYVLSKKPDPLEISAAFQEAKIKPLSKPEVYFIKYKTQEEAQNVQRTIQAQYDSLGGTTQISDEGVAPLTSVVGSFDQHKNPESQSTTGNYLPPAQHTHK